MMIKQNLSLLTGNFEVVLKKKPKIIDFENKRAYFLEKI